MKNGFIDGVTFLGFYSEDDCYKVTIDDSVSFTEFMEHYEILDYEDGIYTIKIKENE